MRLYNLMANYDLTRSEAKEVIKASYGACDICGRIPSQDPDAKHNQRILHYDHNHRTGKKRGMLCSNCNRGIGLLGDNPLTYLRTADYLAESEVS